MKRLITIITILMLIASLITGCGNSAQEEPDPAVQEETVQEDTAQEEAITEDAGSHYEFRPVVTSKYLEDTFGKTMCDTWVKIVDAVMAGEDTFECPDQHTYDWVMGQFPTICFPVLDEVIEVYYDGDNNIHDGRARFQYLVSKEEAKEKIEEFEGIVEEILNRVLKDDYTDFEKTLALYIYFIETFEYDYDAYYKMTDEYVDYLSPYRLLTEGTGVCADIGGAYTYLLMQAGVEATSMSGHYLGGEGHEWTYVNLNGKNYHIDPTFALGEQDSLAYFLINDDRRETDGFDKSDNWATSIYVKEYGLPGYDAEDDTFSDLWEGFFEDFDHDTHILTYYVIDENGEKEYRTFDYTGY